MSVRVVEAAEGKDAADHLAAGLTVPDLVPVALDTQDTNEGWQGELPALADHLNDSEAFIRSYVVITDAQATFLALWGFHTHAFEAADATPYGHINSPEAESGKTLLLEVMELLAGRPIMVGGTATSAALARSAATDPPPTLLLDEPDHTFQRDREYQATVRQILNAGYRRGGCALLCLPPRWEPTLMPVFAPKLIAGIGELPDTLASRSVPIVMKRKTREETVTGFRRRAVTERAKSLHQAAEALAARHVDALTGRTPELPEELSDRQQDVWEPLFAIADVAGENWPERARTPALELRGERDVDDASAGVQLLAHIKDVFEDDRMACAALVSVLNDEELFPYGGWNEGKGITTRELGKKLSRYRIKAIAFGCCLGARR
jgi:Protein of unknown function (DUF3631)